jgi:Lrp/AsnC family transcriptional regulator, leucine-responsive regulatory protein
VDLDELDVALVRALQADARTSFRTLATTLKTTTPTVSSRIKRLESLGIIRGYRVDLDPQALGGSLHYVRVHVVPAHLQPVADALAAQLGVEEVAMLAGGGLLAKVRVRPPAMTMPRLHAFIAGLEGVQQYEAWEAWHVRHQAADLGATGMQVRCHECQSPITGDPVRAKAGPRDNIFCCPLCKRTFLERHKAVLAASKS